MVYMLEYVLWCVEEEELRKEYLDGVILKCGLLKNYMLFG